MNCKKYVSILVCATVFCALAAVGFATNAIANSLVIEGVSEGQKFETGDELWITVKTVDGSPVDVVMLESPAFDNVVEYMPGVPFGVPMMTATRKDIASRASNASGFTFKAKIKSAVLGPTYFAASAYTESGKIYESNRINAEIITTSTLKRIYTEHQAVRVRVNGKNPVKIKIYGDYSDGIQRLISFAPETKYKIYTDEVLRVNEKKEFVGIIDGETGFEVFNGGVSGDFIAEVTGANASPRFTYVSVNRMGYNNAYIGEALLIDVKAEDPDSSPPEFLIGAMPEGASFIDNGDGTGQVHWIPDEVDLGKVEPIVLLAIDPVNPELLSDNLTIFFKILER